jgi:signal transduction histidine kinase
MTAHHSSESAVDALDIETLKRSVLVAEKAANAANMLAEASVLLASSLDYETTLASLARLSTAAFADWCAVDLVNDDGSIRHLTVTHANPVLRDLAAQFQVEVFQEPGGMAAAPRALMLRKSVLLRDVDGADLTGVHPQAKIMQLIGALGVRSLISVPLVVRGKVLGTTTFSSSRRCYDEADLHLAEQLSQRAAVAIDTAMLFREAQSANRYKDEFLGTVAHELRTPLTSIIGWMQLGQSHPEMRDEALAHIGESAGLLRVFIEDLLDITRIREQKMAMEMTDLDLAEVVQSSCAITANAATERNVHVGLHLGLVPAPVRGDRVRLLQVLWNLLSNAVKFTEPGGSIDVRLEREGNNAQITIADTGAGMHADFLPHVFELYRQADEATGHLPGLGIGLSIVAEIVKMHGGAVHATSSGLGCGSSFVVSVPLVEDTADDSTVRRRRSDRLPERRGVLNCRSEEPS